MTTDQPATEDHLLYRGGCLCGAIRYRIESASRLKGGHCHCASCRRASGALAVAWFTVPLGRLHFDRGRPALYRSSSDVERRFCAACGTPITYRSLKESNTIDITVGSLDQPDMIRLTRHVWTSHRVPGVTLDPELPAHPTTSASGVEP